MLQTFYVCTSADSRDHYLLKDVMSSLGISVYNVQLDSYDYIHVTLSNEQIA